MTKAGVRGWHIGGTWNNVNGTIDEQVHNWLV